MNTLRERRPERAATAERPETWARSAEVILIPKQLRMEWTDVIMLDPSLPPLAKVVAGVIGAHLNRHRGDTYLRQDTIADQLDISLRAVQTAIGKLEAAGYLVIDRRELGQRADGRRACGGRGVANTYAPALDGAQVSATQGGKRLAERVEQLMAERTHRRASIRAAKDAPACVHSDPERTNNPQGKDAPACVPTLTDPSDQNPSRARGGAAQGPAQDTSAIAFQQELQRRLGAALFRSWFAEIAFEAVLPGKVPELVLAAPSRFIADRILSHHADDVLACFNALQPAQGRCGRLAMVVKAGTVKGAAR